MDGSTLLAKTPKGVDELENRTYGLPSRTRQVLIMADGKRDLATIAEMISVDALNMVLDQLLMDGFLTPVNSHRDVAVPKTGRTLDDNFVVPTDPQERLKLARNFIINTTETFVGVFGSGLVKQVQKAQSSDELRKLVDIWQDAISSETGKKRAADLKARLMELL